MKFIYVYCLLKNIGFYMEPDIELVKVFMTLKECKYYMKKHPLSHGNYFYERKRVYLSENI